MLVSINIDEKKIGAKELFNGLSLVLSPGEKVAIIGRNGIGKTTLFNILSGADDNYGGRIDRRRGLRVVMTAQEYRAPSGYSCIDYILDRLPEYAQLRQTISDYERHNHTDLAKIQSYTDALERFDSLGYHDAAEKAVRLLGKYQISRVMAEGDFKKLSGGQKRFVDLVRVELAEADLALIDEPTNHMDYVAKQVFIGWLRQTAQAVCVITHDRDVLAEVDRIVEIKDGQAQNFPGNYDAYLLQNSQSTVGAIGQYEVMLRTVDKLKKQIAYARSKKAGWGGTADKKNPFVVMEERLTKQLNQLQANVAKPSFWIDKESVDQLDDRVLESYDRYKARNIRVNAGASGQFVRQLLKAAELSLGYEQPLFEGLNFQLGSSSRLQIRGRNGAGKTTLVRAIISQSHGEEPQSKRFAGQLELDKRLKIGVYEQEVPEVLLNQTLGQAVETIFRQHGAVVSEQRIKQTLADYLFDPRVDISLPVERLSGGQKARLQLIALLAGGPNLLILDEPTNHLDLPSIEELEAALDRFDGAILYVSHDSYFCRNLGGEVAELSPSSLGTAS